MPDVALFFYVNCQNGSYNNASFSGRKQLGLGLSGPPTAPLLRQLELLAASHGCVEQDGRPRGTLSTLLQLNSCNSASLSTLFGMNVLEQVVVENV